jgi:hypothetical protein
VPLGVGGRTYRMHAARAATALACSIPLRYVAQSVDAARVGGTISAPGAYPHIDHLWWQSKLWYIIAECKFDSVKVRIGYV